MFHIHSASLMSINCEILLPVIVCDWMDASASSSCIVSIQSIAGGANKIIFGINILIVCNEIQFDWWLQFSEVAPNI